MAFLTFEGIFGGNFEVDVGRSAKALRSATCNMSQGYQLNICSRTEQQGPITTLYPIWKSRFFLTENTLSFF